MPKENRFAGLGNAIDGDDGDDGERGTEDKAAETQADESEESAASSNDGSASTDVGEEATESPTDGEVASDDANDSVQNDEPGDEVQNDELADQSEPEGSGPAFEFEATTAKSIYVRQTTLDQLDDAEFEVESLLRKDHDIRNLTGREFHDALVRIATEHPDEIVDAILETRDE